MKNLTNLCKEVNSYKEEVNKKIEEYEVNICSKHK